MGDSAASSSPPPRNRFVRGMRGVLGWVDRGVERIEEAILGCAVLFLAGLLIVHVLGRQLFGTGVPGQVEMTQMALVILTFAGIGYGVRKARHISMSALYDQLQGKARKTMLVGITVLTGLLMFYLAWHAWDYVDTMRARGRASAALGIPLWIPYVMAPAGFALAGLQYWLTAFRNLTSTGIYRSFTEREQYEDVPDENAGGKAGERC